MKCTPLALSLLALTLTATACKSGKDEPAPQPQPEQPAVPSTPDRPSDPSGPDAPRPSEKPSDVHIATRMQVEWSGDEASRLSELAIEEFAWGKDTSAITLSKLTPYVRFYSSAPEGKNFYTLTADDLKELQLTSLSYVEGPGGADRLTFGIRYRGIAGVQNLSLPVDRTAYFAQRIRLNRDFAPAHFFGGVAQNFSVYTGSLLSYDTDRYAVVLSEPQPNYGEESLSYRATVHLSRYRNVEALTMNFTTTSFRSLSALSSRLLLSTTIPLNDYIRERLQRGNMRDESRIVTWLNLNPASWLRLAGVSLRSEDGSSASSLAWSNEGTTLSGGLRDGADTRDLYLDRVRFEVTSATFSEDRNQLTIALRLTQANGEVVSGVTSTLVIRSLNLNN